MNKTIINIITGLIGMVLLAVGLNLIILVNIGFGPFDSLTLLVQEAFNINKFGDAALLIHTLFVILLFIYYVIEKRNLLLLIVSYISIFILTRIINLFDFLTDINTDNLIITSCYFIFGFIIYATGIYILSKINILIPPYDKFVAELSSLLKFNLGRIRIIIDGSILVITFVFSILLSISIPFTLGTLFITFCTGYAMSIIEKIHTKIKIKLQK